MRIAYIIIAHINLDQLATLVDLLTLETDDFCFIILDSKSIDFNDVKYFESRVSSCKYQIDCSVEINWGGFSIVESTLKTLITILKHKSNFSYIFLLSGMDLPLKSNTEIHRTLYSNPCEYYLDYFELPDKRWGLPYGGNERFEYFWFIDDAGFEEAKRNVNLQALAGKNRNRPAEIKNIFGGSQWWTITPTCARFILEFVLRFPNVLKFFRYTKIPDEMFFQTVILNSEIAKEGCNNNLRFIDWETGIEYPRVFDISDYSRLTSSEKLFARKFDRNKDAIIISKIIQHINPKYFETMKY